MAFISRNIWLGFYLVSFMWLVSLGGSSFTTYERVYEELVTEQVNITSMSRNSLKATFKQYETILNIVASQVLKNDQVADKKELKSIMQAATKVDSSISALGLFDLDGLTVVSHPLYPVDKSESLFTISTTQETFQATKSIEGMLIGRTYYSEVLDSLIIPFRLAIRDSKGKVQFILSIAVSLDKGFDFFVKNLNKREYHNTYLYRENDHYFQLAPINRIKDNNIYQYQIAQSDIDISTQRLEKGLGIPITELKHKEIVFTDEDPHPARQSLITSVFIKDYALWLITEIKLSKVYKAFLEKVTLLVLVHILSIALIFILFRNIATSEKKKTTELEFQANHDHLTHLLNRYYLDKYLATVDTDTGFAHIYINIDHFKTINDIHGHITGDKLLKKVAYIVNSIANKGDLVIRSGGDEFTVLSFDQTEQQTTTLCNRLLSSLNEKLIINDIEIIISASIGVSLFPKDSNDPEAIKRNADLAMFSAKKEKNRVVFFNEYLLEDYLHICSVEQELKKAIVNKELYMVYQPQFTEDGDIVGVEALIRWKNEKLGQTPPDRFIPIAESMGNMGEIGSFIISQTLSDMVTLQEKTGLKYSVSVNVSVKQFKEDDFFEKLIASVNYYKFPAELLILEVTESVLIDDVETMKNLMLKIKLHNIRISLDDFGTGYSSLSLLNKLPIDELKIDKSFIDDILKDDETRSMIKSIISIAKNKKLKTVAEGIETKEMLEALKILECDIYQGYYFSKPIQKSQLEKLIINEVVSKE